MARLGWAGVIVARSRRSSTPSREYVGMKEENRRGAEKKKRGRNRSALTQGIPAHTLSFLDQENVVEARKVRLLFTRESKEEISKGSKQHGVILDQLRSINPSIDVERAMTLVFKKTKLPFRWEK